MQPVRPKQQKYFLYKQTIFFFYFSSRFVSLRYSVYSAQCPLYGPDFTPFALVLFVKSLKHVWALRSVSRTISDRKRCGERTAHRKYVMVHFSTVFLNISRFWYGTVEGCRRKLYVKQQIAFIWLLRLIIPRQCRVGLGIAGLRECVNPKQRKYSHTGM